MNTKAVWEERSKKYGNRIEGVLPKSFPKFVNRHLDEWMYERVKPESDRLKALDLGCGYGRLAKYILNDFPNTRVFGIDISRNYISLFNKNLKPRGRAVVGDVRRLPFKDSTFDHVYAVTTFMYLTKRVDQLKAIKEMLRVLKPGGKFIVIERNPNGHKLLTLGGLITFLRGIKNKEIESFSYKKEYMRALINESGERISGMGSWPWPILTLAMYISYSGQKKSK